MVVYYTIPRTTGELQLDRSTIAKWERLYHTKNHRGTTTYYSANSSHCQIIPYQEPPGNYNALAIFSAPVGIIPYQEPPGNYNLRLFIRLFIFKLYHTKNHRGTTTQCRVSDEGIRLYHTKNHRGTTTEHLQLFMKRLLYHTKNHRGTTTVRQS